MPIRSTQSFTNELIPPEASESIPLAFLLLRTIFPFLTTLPFPQLSKAMSPVSVSERYPWLMYPVVNDALKFLSARVQNTDSCVWRDFYEVQVPIFIHFFGARTPRNERPRGILYNRPLTQSQYNLGQKAMSSFNLD